MTRAVVNAAPPTAARSTITRGISPFDSQVEFPHRRSAPATMSVVTLDTTTTTTVLPFESHAQDDYLRMLTTAYTRTAIRDPNAERPVFVTWHGEIG